MDRTIAVVNGHLVTWSDLDEQMRFEALENGRALKDLSEAERHAAFEHLVQSRILRDQMQGSAPATDSEVNARIGELRAALAAGKRRCEVGSYASPDTDFPPRSCARWWQTSWRFCTFMEFRVRPLVRVSRAEVEDYYSQTLAPLVKATGQRLEPVEAVTPKIRELLAGAEDESGDGEVAGDSAGAEPGADVVGRRAVEQYVRRSGRTMSEEPELENSGAGADLAGRSDAERRSSARANAALWRYARILLWMTAVGLAVVMAALGMVVRYMESAEFHERVRQFAVAQVERATGGRVELQRVEWNLAHLQFELYGLTDPWKGGGNGGSAASGGAGAGAGEVDAAAAWTSFLPRAERVAAAGSRGCVQRRFDESSWSRSCRLERVRTPPRNCCGWRWTCRADRWPAQWNDEKIKLEGAAEDVVLELGYRAADIHYEGKAKLGQVRMQLPKWEPLTVGAEARFRLYATEWKCRSCE